MNTKHYYTSEAQILAMQEELANAHILVSHEKSSYKKKKIIHYTTSIVSFAIIAVLVYILMTVTTARSKGEVPTVFGYQIYEIKSGSMDPTLPVNALILSKQVDEQDILEVGDVITFVHNDITITHRIVDVINTNNERFYQTKGDNAANSIDPDVIPQKEVKAKFVVKLPFYLSNSEDTGGEDNG